MSSFPKFDLSKGLPNPIAWMREYRSLNGASLTEAREQWAIFEAANRKQHAGKAAPGKAIIQKGALKAGVEEPDESRLQADQLVNLIMGDGVDGPVSKEHASFLIESVLRAKNDALEVADAVLSTPGAASAVHADPLTGAALSPALVQIRDARAGETRGPVPRVTGDSYEETVANLCQWLRENSSGSYRNSSFAADLIEALGRDKAGLSRKISELSMRKALTPAYEDLAQYGESVAEELDAAPDSLHALAEKDPSVLNWMKNERGVLLTVQAKARAALNLTASLRPLNPPAAQPGLQHGHQL